MKNRFLLLLSLLTLTIISRSQSFFDSPYSRFGIGDVVYHKNSQNMSMGGLHIANRSTLFVNYENPASYSVFDSLSFVFNVGTITNHAKMSSLSYSQQVNSVTLSQLLFGFPVTRWWSGSFGFVPFSSVGYSIVDNTEINPIGTVKYNYWGNGGTNQFYAGSSFSPLKSLSLGVNVNYLFGMINRFRTVEFPSNQNYFNLLKKNAYNIQDLRFDFGMQYTLIMGKINTLTLGATYSNQKDISTTEELYSYRYTGSYTIKDTLEYQATEGSITLPMTYGVGLSFSSGEKLMVGAEMKMENWSKYNSFGKPDSLKDAMNVAFGVKYIPNIFAPRGYFNKVQYRAGVRYSQTPLEINNVRINEFGISFGMLFPIRRLVTMINVGFEYGQRGSLEKGLIKEDFIRFYVGLNVYERWFIKKKFY